MQIDTTDVKAIFSFTSRTHILVKENGRWSINAREPMSFLLKEEKISGPIIYLTDGEAQSLRESGFTYTERDNDSK